MYGIWFYLQTDLGTGFVVSCWTLGMVINTFFFFTQMSIAYLWQFKSVACHKEQVGETFFFLFKAQKD